ncbi:hypothetical protein RB195_000973 [Necator americanus]|uniref:Fibronectin type III domain protein n=1 Tax=Necator americanus TaxID=51031 RepID=A0ABR1DCU0_NECAM
MIVRDVTLSFILFIPGFLSFIDDSKCPSSWTPSGDSCIKPFLRPLSSSEAEKTCVAEGGILLDCDRSGMVDDVADILRGFYDNGLHESTWLVSRRGGETPRAINRQSGKNYKMIDVPSSAAFPFLCSLTRIGRRSLLIQQMLLSTGAPRLISNAPPELYFHSRSDADYVVLPCAVEGNPIPVITWFRNDIDMVIPSGSTVPYLLSGGSLLVPAEPSLAYSSFHCTAKNKYGEVRGPSTILKPAFLDSFRPHRGNVVPLYNGGAKLECEAPNHQPKSYSFLWLYDSSTDRILPNTERTLVSLDGTLYFSYVTKNDETSYACSLSLSSTQSGHYGPFFRLQVPSPQETPFPPRIDSSQPQVFPEAPTLGSTVYLECFAYGNPVPVYKWSRVDGRRVNKKAVSMHHGRVLRIDRAEVSDNGRYKCSAGNSLGVAAGEVTLSLRTPPTIILPLADRLVATESTFTLECPLSTTDAHSTVEWFKDAKPIVPLLMPSHQRKRFNVDQNILTVNSTTTTDSGVYQCIISNEVGLASSSAYVLVRDSPPVFPRQSMPRKLFAVNGSSVSIPCFYYASPKGHSRWADAGGAKLPHKGRVRDHHGVLIIENVLHDDAGYFFCSAHNRLGKAHAQMELVVIDKAQVQVDSQGSLSPEEAMNISCSVAIDCGTPSDCPEAFFKWTFDNRSLDSLSGLHVKTKFREHMRHSVQGRRLVQKVDLQMSPAGMGQRPNKVACFSLYGEDTLELTPKQLLPAPLALKVEQEKQAVRLAWKKTSTHRDIRNHAVSGEADASGGYLVELRTKEDRQWRPAPREVVAETESQSITLDSLTPNTLYQFRVRTVDSATMGDPSAPTPWIRTPPAPPSEAVEGLRWRALDNTTILVEWDPVETVHNSGEHLRYRLSWSLEDNNDAKSESEGKRKFHSYHIETKTPQAIVRMNATDECRMLVFSVRPINDQGIGLTSTDTVAFINTKGEPRQVSFTNATVLNSTHASFSWEWDKVNECGRTRAVQLSCSTEGSDPIVVAVSADFAKWDLGGLSADSKYSCILRPFDVEDNQGEPSAPVEIVTKQKPPTEAPTIKKLSLRTLEDDVGYTTVIEWTAINIPDTNFTDETSGYKIFVYVSETASEAVVLTMPINRLSNPERPSARLDGLRLMYLYTIQVAGYNSGGLGPLSSPRIIRLGPQYSLDEPSSARSLRFMYSLFVFWCLFV